VEGLLAASASGKHIALPGSLEVWREFDAIVLKKHGGLAPSDPVDLITIDSARPGIEACGFAFALERGLPGESLRSLIEETFREWNRTGRDWMSVALDDRALPGRLIIRTRLPGERAHVIGRRRTIKLKNLMIDHRIPSSRRASWPLVTTPDGAYVWSPGLPPALAFAAHKETCSLAMMRALAL
jgi:tRNA(Ile)-lysidine synthase